MSSPSIPKPIPSSKDPPPHPSSTHTLSPPSALRKQSYTRSSTQQQDSLSPSPSTLTNTTRPEFPPRSTSFDPHIHVLNPEESTSGIPQVTALNTNRDEQGHSARTLNPFFTLIHDIDVDGAAGAREVGDGGTTIHPRNVHYIFSDDDGNEVLNATFLRLSQAEDGAQMQENMALNTEQTVAGDRLQRSHTSTSSSDATFRKPKHGEKELEERVVILDIDADLTKVNKASSLSPNWQILSATLENAPSFNTQIPSSSSTHQQSKSNVNEEEERGIMLKINGISLSNVSTTAARKENMKGSGGVLGSSRGSGSEMRGSRRGMGEDEMNALMESFDRKMAVLRGIVGNSGGGGEQGVGEQEAESRRGLAGLGLGVGEGIEGEIGGG